MKYSTTYFVFHQEKENVSQLGNSKRKNNFKRFQNTFDV